MIGDKLMSRTVKSADERKKDIIQTAEKLFIEDGYNNVTTSAIAKKTGVAKGTLFYHFETKDNLADAVIKYQLTPLKETYQQINAKKEWSALKKMSWFFLSELDDSLQHVSSFNYLKNDDNAILRQKLRVQMTTDFVPFIENWLTQGVKEDIFQVDDPHLMAEFIFTSFHSWVENSLFGDDLKTRNHRINYVLPLYNQMLHLPQNTFSPENMRKLIQ